MTTKSILGGFVTLLLGVCIFGACNCATNNQENVTADTTAVVLVEETAVAEPVVAAEDTLIKVEK